MRRQTYGYLPSRTASPPLDRYQIILLGDRGTCVRTTCPGLLSESARQGVEPATFGVASPTPNHYAAWPHAAETAGSNYRTGHRSDASACLLSVNARRQRAVQCRCLMLTRHDITCSPALLSATRQTTHYGTKSPRSRTCSPATPPPSQTAAPRSDAP